jgi:hypothetical protein
MISCKHKVIIVVNDKMEYRIAVNQLFDSNSDNVQTSDLAKFM